MKRLLLATIAIATLAIATLTTAVALADHYWSGTAVGYSTQTPTDLNGDGIVARQFYGRVQQTAWERLEYFLTGHTDTFYETQGLIDVGFADPAACPEGGLPLSARGKGMLRTEDGQDMMVFAFDPTSTLCSIPGQIETTTATILPEGRGEYAKATGTVEIVLLDRVLLADAVTYEPWLLDFQADLTVIQGPDAP